MRLFIFLVTTFVCVTANNDVQYMNVKSVKGHSGYRQYNPGAKLPNFYGNGTQGYGGYDRQNNTQQGYNTTYQRDYEIGVCYIEVPTVNLVHSQGYVPRGNGSRPDLSRIRSCCKGYIRNIHNFRICDPVCTQECVNALCTGPDTCTCFPDHVKNLAGFCIPTCPIGCQNGHCSGGECLCKEGFKLDSESKYCLPNCRENCGGIGNCTAPNTCECNKGYQSSPDGNCKPVCDTCVNGDCVAPNECRCSQGYRKDQQGLCVPQCTDNCAPNGKCVAPGRCEFPEIKTTTVISPPSQHPYIPLYPGSQVGSGNQGRPINHTGSVNPMQPGSQYYPGQAEQVQPGYGGYPGYPNQRYPGHGYPGNQRYPGGQGYPVNQENPGNQGLPGNQVNPVGNGYPGQQVNPGSQGSPDSQTNTGSHGHSGRHTYPESHGLSGNQEYPGSHGYPGNPNPGGQGYPGNQEISGGQSYTGNQIYPGGPQVNSTSPSTYGQQGFIGSQGQTGYQNQLYPDIQQYNQEFQCSQPCINGFCVEGNRCQCNRGYVLDNTDVTETRCIAHCPGGCPNGICSAPNFCICNMGYYKDTSVKGRPRCVKRNKRSVADEVPNVAKLLVFDIPEYNEA
ncbi:fibrillin-2-like [Zerene cesonia]|uniref:fibrillin-2-like n=1 Tax=Zerene cesonia TaxID=33412 RepID=UPI0018E56BE7|nr:fibrillin-2-like [Zerene cesonia]